MLYVRLAAVRPSLSKEDANHDGLRSPVCHFLANTMGIPESDAGDVDVDVLTKVHRNMMKFTYGGSAKLTTWIYRIARNEGANYHRDSKKNTTATEFDEGTVSSVAEFSFCTPSAPPPPTYAFTLIGRYVTATG